MKRREFVVTSMAAGSLGAAPVSPVPHRAYKAGISLSVIGFGGIVVTRMPQADADRQVSKAFDRGVNYYDVAPTYADGEAEIKLGVALKPYRNKVFLACKTTQRDAAGSLRELERSLQRLHTDRFDLYQFHAVSSMEDVEKILAPGGAAETFEKARKDGKVRFLGFSAHHAGAAIKLIDSLQLDSILFPINFNAWEKGQFGPQIYEHAKKKGLARLALKSLALGQWPKDLKPEARKHPKCWYEPVADPALAELALRFTLSRDVTAAIPPGDERIFEMALDLAAKPMGALSSAEHTRLLSAARTAEPVFKV